MTTFTDWLASAKRTNDPEGDLVADMRRDRDRPPTFQSITAMRDYVRVKSGGDRAVLAAVPGAWRRYKLWLARHSADA